MKKNTWIWVVFAVLVVLAVVYPFLTKNSPLIAKPVYQQMDFNGDGKVSKDEFGANRAKILASTDKNSDGKMTSEEYALLLSRSDINKDGVITKEEYLTYFVGKDELSTEDAANLNYFVNNYPEGFTMIDANKDGSISVTEFKAYRLAIFNDLDKNKDSQLSKDEVQAGSAKRVKAFDKNKDNALNVEEYTVGIIMMPPPPKPAAPAAAPVAKPTAAPAQK